MNEDISVRLVVSDDQITSVLEGVSTKAVESQEKIDGIGKQADETTKKVTQGFKDQERAIIDSTKAADDYKRSIEENKARIDQLNRSVEKEKLILAQLRKEYNQFGDKSSKSAIAVKKQMDLLSKSIKGVSEDTKILAQQNIVAKNALDDLAKGGNKSAQQIKLTSHEALNLSYQFQDLAVQIGSGQGIFRPLLQQVPQMIGALGGSRRALKFFTQQISNTLKTIFSLKGGFIALGLGIAGLLIVPLVSFFAKSQQVADFFGKKIDYLSGAFKELTDRAFRVGEALVGVFTGANDGAAVIDALSDAVTGIGKAMDEAGQAAISYAAHLKTLKREQEEFIVTEGEVLAKIDERRRAVDDDTKTFSSRKSALRETMALEADLENQRIKFAQSNLERVRNEATGPDGAVEKDAIEEINKAERELIDLRREAASRQAQDAQKLRTLNNEASAAYKERQETLRDLQKQSEALTNQLKDIQRSDAQGIDKIRLDTIKAVEEVHKLEASLRELYDQRGLEFDLAGDFEEAVKVIEQRGTNAIREFNRKRNLEEAKARQQRLDAQRQADLNLIDQRESLALTLVEIDRKQGLDEVEAEQARQRDKLRIQIDFTRQRLAMLENQNSIEAALYRANIESLQQELANIDSTDLSAFQSLGDRIRDALGLTQEDFTNVSNLFSQFGSSLLDTISTLSAAQLEQQKRVTAELADQVQETQTALDAQLKLKEDGFSNDVKLYEDKLKAEEQALAQSKAAELAIQKRQARQQLAIDAAQQTSAYITTVLNLLSSASKGGIIGLIAIAAGGLALVGSIVAKAKSNARQFSAPRFRHGTEFVRGPGTGTSDSIPAFLGVGERVFDYEKNQRFGGDSNADVVKYYEIGKGITMAPSFANVDQKTKSAIKQGGELSQLEREQQNRAMVAAYERAGAKMSKEMINYWKTRPITYETKDGTVIEFEKSGVKVRQTIKEI